MPRGAKPGERRGGRTKGTPNKRTIGEVHARQQRSERIHDDVVKPAHVDSLQQMHLIAGTLRGMAGQELGKEKPDRKFAKELLDSAGRMYASISPYEHRRLATLEPAMEAIIKPDGTVSVKISRVDDEL